MGLLLSAEQAGAARRQRKLGRFVEAALRADGVWAKLEAVVAIVATLGMVVCVALPMAIRPLRGNQDAVRPAIAGALEAVLPADMAQSVLHAMFAGDYSWMPQLSRFALIWATFAGASLATRVRGHIVVDLVTKIAPRRVRAVLNVGAALLAVLLCAALSVVGAYVVWRNWEQATVLRGVDWGKAHIVIPVTLGIMAVRFLILGLEDLDGALSGDLAYLDRHEADEREHLREAAGVERGVDTPLPAGQGEAARDAAAAAGDEARAEAGEGRPGADNGDEERAS